MKSKVLLIVTQGCEACAISKKLTDAAITIHNLNVAYEVSDIAQVPPSLLKQANINDFPTTLLIKDNNIIDSYYGTKPINFIAKKIKLLV